MTQLIDKDKAIAEIERLKKEEGWCQVGKDTADVYYARGFRFACERIINVFNTLEVKEVNLDEEVDKNDYRKLFEDSTKLNIDSTTEIKFDESTKFKWDDYIKMKEEKTITSKFYKRLFKNIPTVSMKIFSWWNRNKRKENKL